VSEPGRGEQSRSPIRYAQGKLRAETRLAKVATEIGEQVQALLEARGLTLIPQAMQNRFGSAIQSRLVRIGTEDMENPPEEEGKAVFGEIEKLLTKEQKRVPGYTAVVNPVLTTSPGEAKGEWEIVLRPKGESQQATTSPTSREATEEVWCAVKHYVALEGHLGEMIANAAVAGQPEALAAYGQLLSQATGARRALMERALTGRTSGRGCQGCREDREI